MEGKIHPHSHDSRSPKLGNSQLHGERFEHRLLRQNPFEWLVFWSGYITRRVMATL
jgi:hypothetical protein